jgi:uncharacterized protein HemX
MMINHMNKQQSDTVLGGRALAFLVAGASLGAGLFLFFTVRARRGKQRVVDRYFDNVVDDQGTDQNEAARLLKNLRDRAFQASDERLALALGRPTDEVRGWNTGQDVIDDDVIMKARGIALQRGVTLD